MPTALPWILASAAFCLLGGAAALLALTHRGPAADTPAPPPEGGSFPTFPVFDPVERAAFQTLRSALPDCLILAKLPLERFCRPAVAARSPRELAAFAGLDVDFALCSGSGRVLAAVDLERGDDAAAERRRFKARVLRRGPVRYLRCAPEAMPSVAELQALVGTVAAPASNAAVRRVERRRDSHLWLDAAPRAVPAGDADAGAPPWVRSSRRSAERLRGLDAPTAPASTLRH